MIDYRSSHLHKGADYDALFHAGSYPHLLWKFERDILKEIVDGRFRGRPFDHLDVACGTGRILQHIRPWARQSCGIDISSSMLQIARARAAGASVIRGDFAAPNPPFARRFDLVTCFRFFLNAEHNLRAGVARNAAVHLSDRGIFVFNNHRNYHSLTYRMLRAAGRSAAHLACMKHSDAETLVAEAGLKIVAVYHIGIVPGTDQRMYLPYGLSARIEQMATRVRALASLSNDLLYVCERV
jgi:SAM-dependent methyltransferase